jgi:hypothetical protein
MSLFGSPSSPEGIEHELTQLIKRLDRLSPLLDSVGDLIDNLDERLTEMESEQIELRTDVDQIKLWMNSVLAVNDEPTI